MSTCPEGVRIATKKDAVPLFALIWMAHEECALAPRSDLKVRNMVRVALDQKMLADPVTGASVAPPVFGVIDGTDDLVAVMGLCTVDHWYSDRQYLRGFLTYVHPEHRRSTHAKRLLEFGNWWAEEMGMEVLYENWNPLGAPQKNKLFGRHATMVGGLFQHRPGAAA